MRVAYFGNDMFYGCMELLLQSGHEIIRLFTDTAEHGESSEEPEYDFTQNVRKQAEILSIPITTTAPTAKDIKELEQQGCELIVCAGYLYKIPRWDGGSIRYGINIHPTLLPEGAGPVPMPLVILKGLKKTGVTLHKLAQEFDSGDIILQKSFPLSGKENLEYILSNSQILAAKLLGRFLDLPKECWNSSYPQTHKEGDYWPKPTREELTIDFTKDIEIVGRSLRAHRFVKPNGDIEFIENVSLQKKEHDFAPRTTLSEKDGVYLVAAEGGLAYFELKTKPSPQCNFIHKKD